MVRVFIGGKEIKSKEECKNYTVRSEVLDRILANKNYGKKEKGA